MNTVLASDNPGLNAALGMWLAHALELPRPFRAPYLTMGIFDGSEIVGVVIFENYRPEDGTVEIGAAMSSPKWFSRRVMREIAAVVFQKLKCQMAILRTGSKNTEACRFLEKFGAEHVVIPRGRGRDEDEYFFFLTDDRWHQSRLSGQRGQNA